MKKQTSLIKNQKGAILLEFVLCFPILFVLFLFVMQLAQIMITWQVVHYAAYMGARSSMTTNLLYRQSTAEKVVKRVLAVVSASPDDEKGNSGDKDKKENKHADDKYSKLDGWGYLPATKYLEKQVDVDISKIDLIPGGVRCTVKFKMFLHVPVAGALISFFAKENKTEEEKKEALREKIFAYLDTSTDWQFSLFDYEEVRKVKVETIPGSRIYPPENASVVH